MDPKKDRGLGLLKRHVDMTDRETRLLILRCEFAGFRVEIESVSGDYLLKFPTGEIAITKTIGATMRFLEQIEWHGSKSNG